MVMEYLEGASLRRIVRRLRARGDSEAARALYVRAILDVLVALEYAHSLRDFDGRALNLVHRDVNPSNVVVLHSGQVKLLDFGIAKAADSAQETRAGVLKGKLHYMPPEQMAGDKIRRPRRPLRRRHDALGRAHRSEALGGREGPRRHHVARAWVNRPAAVRQSRPLGRACDRVCMRALSFKRPADRYPDAASFRADLEKELGGHVMTNSELAAAMASEFLEEQERMRTLIAEQLRTVDEASSAVIPTIASEIPPPHTGASTDVSRTPARASSMTPRRQELDIRGLRGGGDAVEGDHLGRGGMRGGVLGRHRSRLRASREPSASPIPRATSAPCPHRAATAATEPRAERRRRRIMRPQPPSRPRPPRSRRRRTAGARGLRGAAATAMDGRPRPAHRRRQPGLRLPTRARPWHRPRSCRPRRRRSRRPLRRRQIMRSLPHPPRRRPRRRPWLRSIHLRLPQRPFRAVASRSPKPTRSCWRISTRSAGASSEERWTNFT